MKKVIGYLVPMILAIGAVAAEPLYSKHDYIKGGVEILTNVEEWVSGKLSAVSGEIQEINQKIENIPSDERLNEVAQASTNYTDEAKQELTGQMEGLVPDMAKYAGTAGTAEALKGEGETRQATTIFQTLDKSVTSNDVQKAINDVDTSYIWVDGITNLNQTVQYVVLTNTEPSVLEIQIPEKGETRDWLVYVRAQTNVTIKLPPATYWMRDTTVTNNIKSNKLTALYFSEVTRGTFSFGRAEFEEIVITE